jgi:DNA invertase Pin-like site-specific DNA recombinase
MKVGYARVSSLGQSLDTQIEKLTAFGCEKMFQEKRSGATREKREAVNEALEYCREGDVLVITKLDRLARSMSDLTTAFSPGQWWRSSSHPVSEHTV